MAAVYTATAPVPSTMLKPGREMFATGEREASQQKRTRKAGKTEECQGVRRTQHDFGLPAAMAFSAAEVVHARAGGELPGDARTLDPLP
jgi:hypothetical protein